MGIKHVRCTPQHPESNGKIERFHRTFKNMLSKAINNAPGDWEDHVGSVLFSHHISVSDVTHYSPFYLVYGRQPRAPLTKLLHSRDAIQGFGTRVDNLSTALKAARDHTEDSRKYNKLRLDCKANDGLLNPGDMVVLLAAKPLTFTSKWDPHWQVTRISGTTVFQRHQQSGQTKRVHRSKVRLVDPHMVWDHVAPTPKQRQKQRGTPEVTVDVHVDPPNIAVHPPQSQSGQDSNLEGSEEPLPSTSADPMEIETEGPDPMEIETERVLSGRSAPLRSLHPGQVHGGAAYRRRRNVTREFATMFLLGALIGFMTLVASTLSQKAGITIKNLHQGLLIQQQGGLFYQSAEWTVLLTLMAPAMTKELMDFSRLLQAQITKVSTRYPQLADSWNSRLQWCQNILQHFYSGRTKRAPLGFIGRISHTLFGTVKEEELAQYRSIIMDTHSLLNHTVHRSNLLLSATKANRRHINLNSDHINKLKRYLVTLQLAVKTNFHVISDTLSRLSLKMKIEHALVSLEQNVNRIINYFNRRRRQRHSLYHHTLTEDLLGPGQLQEILAQARALRFATMLQNWYYEFCKVLPVWTNPLDITFKVSLPLHDGKNYILYSIHSYPFPIRPGFHAHLQVRSTVAYSSTSGLLFEPILCQGSRTKVCRGGPLVDADKFVCERALVSKDAVATRKCQVKVLQSNGTITQEVTPGLYIVSTPLISPKMHFDATPVSLKAVIGLFLDLTVSSPPYT